MSPQRARMIDDMILAGLAEGTRKLYVVGIVGGRQFTACRCRGPIRCSGPWYQFAYRHSHP
jgi:hypothetical protein